MFFFALFSWRYSNYATKLVIAISFCLDDLITALQGKKIFYLTPARWLKSRSDVSRLVHFVHTNRELNSRQDTLMAALRQLTVRIRQTRARFFSRISWIAWKRSSIFYRLHRRVYKTRDKPGRVFDSTIRNSRCIHIYYRSESVISMNWILNIARDNSFKKTKKCISIEEFNI